MAERPAANGLGQNRLARANWPSPDQRQPKRLRFQTELTAEVFVGLEEWRNASIPPCLKGHRGCDCGLMRHGTCGRKTPVPICVTRFGFRDCPTTISRRPDFAAPRPNGMMPGFWPFRPHGTSTRCSENAPGIDPVVFGRAALILLWPGSPYGLSLDFAPSPRDRIPA